MRWQGAVDVCLSAARRPSNVERAQYFGTSAVDLRMNIRRATTTLSSLSPYLYANWMMHVNTMTLGGKHFAEGSDGGCCNDQMALRLLVF